VRDLVELGILRRASDVVKTTSIDVRRAYPVPTHDRVARVREIRTWLEARGVHSVGRLGEWEYVNSDECLRRGLALGRALAVELGGAAAGASA
jgi:UDP-galactopyranose mutase